jgi:hypothetical protein
VPHMNPPEGALYVMDTCLVYPDCADKLTPISFLRLTPALNVPAVPLFLVKPPGAPRFPPQFLKGKSGG